MLWISTLTIRAADRFVSLFGTNDTDNGYTNWIGAATNIQMAVDKALSFDTILVSNGVYNLTNQVSIATTYLTVKSVNGRDNTFVNGNYPNITSRCFYITAKGVVLDGFTITNGYSYSNAVASNGGDGGGIYIYINSAAYGTNSCVVKNCTISRNTANKETSSGNGGGIYLYQYHYITNCIISYNTATGWTNHTGGGVKATLSLMSDCQIFNNIAATNESSGGGGQGGSYENCQIYGNLATRGGGINYSAGNIRNCLFTKNVAVKHGGGIYLAGNGYDGYDFSCNTIVSNYCGVSSSAGGAQFQSTPNFIYNCIIQSNAPNDIGGGSTNSLYFCNFNKMAHTNFTRINCITNNPLFVDSVNGNWRLTSRSPCVNAGYNQGWMMTNSVDLDGRARIRYGTVDMGAHECVYGGVVYSIH